MGNKNDDWEQKYWQYRQRKSEGSEYTQMPPANPNDLPHYEPAHVSLGRDVPIARPNSNPNVPNSEHGWREVDLNAALYAKIASGANPLGTGQATQQNHKTVLLRPGAICYKAVNTGEFGGSAILVKSLGPYNESVHREFVVKGICKCYCVDNLQIIDLSNISSHKQLELVELNAPLVGAILVEKKDIVSASSSGQQILKG